MSQDDPTRRVPWAPMAAAVLALALLVGVGAWGVQRSAGARLALENADWADAPLPDADAPVDSALSATGADLFQAHCAACHVVRGAPKLGPNLAGVTERRSLPWIRAMMLRPDSMTRDDAVASELKARYGGVQMMVMGRIGPAEVRAILEFLRRVDLQGPVADGG